MPPPTPILLLKTRSAPHDAYFSMFSAPAYSSTFVPVLEHQPNTTNLSRVRNLLRNDITHSYGGLIFTSQRAVEGFATVVQEETEETGETVGSMVRYRPSTSRRSQSNKGNRKVLNTLSIPLYVVGPATSRTLTGVRDVHLPKCDVLGQDTGNGEKLAHYILDHYNGKHSRGGASNPPLLFLVGEQRRDIIPRTLTAEGLPESERIRVDELVVYETTEMASFPKDFAAAIKDARTNAGDGGIMWIVVFSPPGCKAMLKGLGWLDEETGKYRGRENGTRDVFVATIGPTTRDYLEKMFGYEADVCAEKPSPEGVREGIERFLREEMS